MTSPTKGWLHCLFIVSGLSLVLLTSACTSDNKVSDVPDDGQRSQDLVTDLEIRQLPGESLALSRYLVTQSTLGETRSLFNAKGEGIVVWKSDTGNGAALKYSVYQPASQTWLPAVTFAETRGASGEVNQDPSIDGSQALATNGESFVLTWSEGRTLQILQVMPGSQDGTGVLKSIDNSGIRNQPPKVIAVGSKYFVIWDIHNSLQAYVIDNTNQSQQTLVSWSDVPPRQVGRLLALGGNSTSLIAAWQLYTTDENRVTTESLHSLVYYPDNADRTVHTVHSQPLVARFNEVIVTAGDTGYGLAWIEILPVNLGDNRDLFASVYRDDGIDPAVWAPAKLLDSGTVTAGPRIRQENIMTGDRAHFLLWSKLIENANTLYFSEAVLADMQNAGWYEGSIMAPGIAPQTNAWPLLSVRGDTLMFLWAAGSTFTIAEYRAGTWRELPFPVPIESYTTVKKVLDLRADGGGFSLFWFKSVDDTHDTLLAARYTGDAWSEAAEITVPLYTESTYSRSQLLSGADRYWYLWSAAGVDDQLTRVYGSAYQNVWGAVQTVGNAGVRGSSWSPQLVQGSADTSVLIWRQYHDGYQDLTAAYRVGDLWSTPYRLTEHAQRKGPSPTMRRANKREFDFYSVANGNRILSAWYDQRRIRIQEMREQGPPVLATIADFQTEAWTQGKVFGLVSRGDSFVICWEKMNTASDTTTLYVSFERGGTWATEEVAVVNMQASVSAQLLALPDGGFSVFWKAIGEQNVRLLYHRDWLNAVAQDAEFVGFLPPISEAYKVAANSTGDLLLLWHQHASPEDPGAARELYYRLFERALGTWTDTVNLPFTFTSYTVMSLGDTFYYFYEDGAGYTLRSYTQADGWGASMALIDEPNTNSSLDTNIVKDGDHILFSWSQQSGGQSRVYARVIGVDGVGDQILLLDNTPEQKAMHPFVSAYKGDFALTWAQFDLMHDPSVTDVFVRPPVSP